MRRRGFIANVRFVVAGLLTACIAAGCGGRTTSTTGRYIVDDRVGQIAPGNTDARWLVMLFGEPTEKQASAGSGEVWVWTYRREIERRSRRSGRVLEWYERKTCVELSPQGAVVNAWTEDAQSVGWNEEWAKVGP